MRRRCECLGDIKGGRDGKGSERFRGFVGICRFGKCWEGLRRVWLFSEALVGRR